MNYMGIYRNLLAQFEKIFKHMNQLSFPTRRRYRYAFQRFMVFLAMVYRLEKLPNIQPKHLRGYVQFIQEKGDSAAYIKTDLSAIRAIHDQIPAAKHRLPGNDGLDLERRSFGKVDQTWEQWEYNQMAAQASLLGYEDYVAALTIARYAALRLHEVFRIDHNTARKALKNGSITIKGKGGLIRTVPINYSIEINLKKLLEATPRGRKLFVEPGDLTHLAMHRLEYFIYYHRKNIRPSDVPEQLTFHGLRHTCAAEWCVEFMEQGMSEKEAHLKVAKLLGHSRDSITRFYTVSLRQDGD